MLAKNLKFILSERKRKKKIERKKVVKKDTFNTRKEENCGCPNEEHKARGKSKEIGDCNVVHYVVHYVFFEKRICLETGYSGLEQ